MERVRVEKGDKKCQELKETKVLCLVFGECACVCVIVCD